MRPILEIQDICKKLKPFLGNKVDNLFLEYSLADTREKKAEIYQIVLALYSKYVDDKVLDGSILLKVPEPKVVEAEYDLGKIHYPNKSPQKFGLREQDWQRHVCITGMSGSGKTTFAMRIIYNFLAKRKPFIVFDWKKSFRQLLYLSKNIVIFTVGKPKASNFFRLNINQPPRGVSADEWITILCDLLSECFGTSYGVHKLLTEVLQKLFRDFGVYAGSENYPTWYQVKDKLEDMAENQSRKHGRESEWLTSALRIAHSLTFGEFGNTINDKNKYNINVEELLSNQIVFELDSLGTIEKKFFCSFILLYIYKLKKASNESTENPFKSAIIVDEAHNIFLKQKSAFYQESVTDTIYREIREYGVSLVCLDQHASKLSDTVLGNSSTNIAFQQILPDDVTAISRLMFLDDDKVIFTKLHVGQAVVKLTERFYDPFLIKVEKLNINTQLVQDTRLRELVKNHVLFSRRLKLWQDQLKTENLVEQYDKINTAYAKTNIKLTNEELLKQIAVKQDMDNALEEQKPKKVMTNHLQKKVFDAIIPMISKAGSLKDAKKMFAQEGFVSTDINTAFNVFSETKEGKQIIDFVDVWKSQILKPNLKKDILDVASKLNISEVIHFVDKLRKTGESLPVSKFFAELQISVRKANDIKNGLVDLGILHINEERSAKGLTKIPQFTKKGYGFMDKVGMPV